MTAGWTEDCRRIGEGDHPVIALHGWFGSGEAWAPLWPHLDRDAFTYAFPDYRGYGRRKGEPGEFTLAEAAADVLALADARGWDRFSLVGHSMGGIVMQRVLADAPDRVRAMVGVAPVPASGVPFDAETRAVFDGAADDPALRRAIVDMTTGKRLTGVWLDAVVAHSVDNSDRDAFAAYLRAWADTDLHEEIEGSPVPVLAVAGEHDPALGADALRPTFGAWYPSAEIEVLANAGHYPADEVPVALATSIERHLAGRS
ncbi:alpha/beta fold hydrolase [Nocardiopsis sp. RSe5-2]|uniref:Alpha/beta fold hydrolase n=1 Tax=Nocardiopsis endophytica TaxID=3018445 RepID=A0ABT4TY90_9ACTN|nr:alpha/beta fold hydrolase [Nocardiopsis endophytica]MDA2809666.1 alpha/beta fold hydrolase [Nocardiopsis endophytica]